MLRFSGLLVAVFAFSSICAQESEVLKKLFSEFDSIQDAHQVENPIWRGQHPETYVFQNIESILEETKQLSAGLQKLKELEQESLSIQDQITLEIKILQLENEVSLVNYKMYLIPFNAEGGFYNRPSFFLANLPFSNQSDYEAYLSWLPSYADYINYNIELLEQGIKEGIMAPKIIVANNILLLKPWVADDLKDNPFYAPFKSLSVTISETEKSQLLAKAEKVLREQVIPSYKKLDDFFQKKYLKKAPEAVGISAIKNGKAYYENRIKHFTTLDMTPEEVFQTGENEVERIRKQMEKIISELKFEGSFAEFLEFLRTDPQFYPTSGQELLSRAAWLSKKAEGQLPKLFSKLYQLPFTVEPVPDAIAPSYTAGRYVGGSRKQNKPGIYWVNTYDLKSRTYYTLPALTLHEAVPGHHLQITLASELDSLPDFRKNYYFSAFGEGWGLYSEYLGEEMGMYSTPYELFGRYTYEMWRACRLVVDVGLHYKGWTRQEALDYMAENTALSMHEVTTEIDRYIGWPGQAVSYKIGELTIKRLRAEATEALGDKFDIQEFHEAILRNGSIPLSSLEAEVDRYVDKSKSNR